MQLDPSIILGAKPAQFENPANQLAKLLQVQEMQQMGRAREMQMQDAQDARASKNRLQSLLSSEYKTPEERESALMRGGFMEQAQALQKSRLDAAKAQGDNLKTQAETEKLRLQTSREQVGFIGQLLNGVKDQNTYNIARSVAQQRGLDVSSIPDQYDPAWVDQAKAQTLTTAEQLDQVWKQKGYDLNVFQAKETQRHNSAAEANQRRGQDLTNAVATERLNFDRAGGVAAAGGANGKLTEAEGKNTLYLSQMRDASNTLDTLEKASPVMVAATGSPYTNWMAGKNAQKVGQTQRQWAEAYLRAKTGAAATAGEVDNNIRTFFPVVGDDDETIAQKAAARKQAENDMEIPAGRGADRAVKRAGSPQANQSARPPLADIFK